VIFTSPSDPAQNALAAVPPPPTTTAKPASLTFSGLDIASKSTAPKRAFAALDDEEESDRKLQKLDLPDFKPEVQTGEEVDAGKIGDDLAVEEDVKPDVEEDEKMEQPEDEEEEDELDAFMRQNNQEVRKVNTSDAKKLGLLNLEDDSDDEAEVKDKAGDELAKAEAILQYVP
jgi:ATP-dependent RNA helicase DDX46/PRP5